MDYGSSMRGALRSTLLVLAGALVLAGCSGDDESASKDDKDHVWKEQTKTIDKARDVGRQLQDAAKKNAAGTQ